MDEMEFGSNILTLEDEEGNSHQFEVIDELEENDNRYFALVPYFEDPENSIEEDLDLVVMKAEIVDDEEMMATIDDDDEYDRIGNIFMDRLEDAMNEEENE